MSKKVYNVLKWLFPEYQIIESIQKYGFIAKGYTSSAPRAVPNATVSQTDSRCRTAELSQQRGGGAVSQTTSQGTAGAVATNSAKFNDKTMPIVIDHSGEAEIGAHGEQIESIVTGMRTNLMAAIIGQESAIENLLVAFKRPLVIGTQGNAPVNTFFVIGGKSSGRHTLLTQAVAAAQSEGLIDCDNISTVNLALYPTASEKSLFLSDLYKALHEKSDVVLFESFENCHAETLQIIISLVTQGKYLFGERYIEQGKNLVQATGALLQDSVSTITANGKYFVFITHLAENKIADKLGQKFMDKVADIIVMDVYSEIHIFRITEKMLSKLLAKVKNNLAINLAFSDTFIKHCVQKFKQKEGLSQISEFIMGIMYNALSEYKLRNRNTCTTFTLDCDLSGGVTLIPDSQRITSAISLMSYLPKRRTSNIDEIKAELADVIGLAKVKEFVLDLENNLNIQKMRENAGHRAASISRHMIFTGNPGTGKTTIARIVAKYFKAIGLLSIGQLREVSRSDLVGQYVGYTAKQTNEVIQSALGGVLFIDEAYSICRDKNDTFGLEAVDALVKAVEDYRDDLVVILAGYQDEMREFLKNNPGLKSRFPNTIDFEDYTANEMVQIAHITARIKGYKITDECIEGLTRLFEKSQIKGRNDGGNGRFVRNVIEAAILSQSKRISRDIPTDQLDLLLAVDFSFENFEKFNIEKRLDEIIGLINVKDFVRTQHRILIADEKRRKAGISVDSTQSLNMIFTGNPGTGKTTIARVVASMFKEMGMLKRGHLVETDRGGLVAEYLGQTAKKTEEKIRDALGGVLFIDEAYALADGGGGFGKEAVDTLVKLIEDFRGEIVVVLSGYKKEMADFLKMNSGLQSRFPLVIDFPDYSKDELYAIAKKTLSAKGFTLTDTAESTLKEQIVLAHKTSTAASGNGRMVRNIVENIMRNQSARIADAIEVTKEEPTEIRSDDIRIPRTAHSGFNLEAEFEKIVGLGKVKDYIRSLAARLRIQNERKKLGLHTDSTQTLHMIFKGNPGTGKTMIARTVADFFYNLGVINTNKLIETDRAGLVAGYVGQTAIKTTDKVNEAIDGVLFIDEAYSLAQGETNDFGREAIDTLVKLMDDNRERLVVMLAGYSRNMDYFLQTNPGLKSRFPNIIEFPDYSPTELMLITENTYAAKGYALSDGAKLKLQNLFQNVVGRDAFGNGRYVRNLFERSLNRQALRLSKDPDLTSEKLMGVEAEDIEEV